MNAILWKEFRENLKWAVVIFVGVAGALALGISQPRPLGFWIAFAPATTTIGAAAGGLLLGVLQTVFEARRDHWALLVHRPISRRDIFWGKVLVGLSLLYLAVGIPYALAMLWAATPGHLAAPFDHRLALPGIIDILVGSSYYFAGLIIGLRQASWFRGRSLSLGLPLICSFATYFLPEFWHALLAAIGCAAIMAIAARSNFLAGGSYESQGRLSRFALGLGVLAGIFILYGLGLALIEEISGGRHPSTYSHYVFDSQGRPLRVTYFDGGDRGAEITDLDGKVVATGHRQVGQFQQDQLPTCWLWREMPRYRGLARYRDAQRILREIPGRLNELWYFTGTDRVVRGYEMRSRRFVGTLSPQGFSPAPQPPLGSFSGDIQQTAMYEWQSGLLVLPQAVYLVDADARSVHRVMAVPAGDEAVAATFIRVANSQRKIVATRKSLCIIDGSGNVLLSTPLAHSIKQYPALQIGWIESSGHYVVIYQMETYAWRCLKPAPVAEIASDGSVVRSYELPALPPAQMRAGMKVTDAGIPPAIAIFGAFVPRDSESAREFGLDWPAFPKILTTALIIGALCAAAAVAFCHRYSFTWLRTGGWAVLALLAGIPGLLLLLALMEWPAMETCPSCARRRMATRQQCEHCSAPFEPPAQDGTEVFEAIPAA